MAQPDDTHSTEGVSWSSLLAGKNTACPKLWETSGTAATRAKRHGNKPLSSAENHYERLYGVLECQRLPLL